MLNSGNAIANGTVEEAEAVPPVEEAMVATRDAGRLASHHGQQALQGPGTVARIHIKGFFSGSQKKEVK